MTEAAYAAVDWGTSSFRVWLIGREGAVLSERRSNEGMTVAAGCGFSKILKTHLTELAAPAELPVVICGMAGARQGWVEAGYLPLPARLDGLGTASVPVPGEARTIRILPGLAQRSTSAPDVMRGEETQILGALSMAEVETARFCMPGTHSKWVAVDGGTVTGFSTFMTGELFDVISRQSILSHSLAGSSRHSEQAFRDGVKAALDAPARFTNLAFGIRAGQLLHGLTPDDAAARLSGLLIGLEIAGATGTAGADQDKTLPVHLIVSGRLAGLYQSALETAGLSCILVDADEAVRRGLAMAARQLGLTA